MEGSWLTGDERRRALAVLTEQTKVAVAVFRGPAFVMVFANDRYKAATGWSEGLRARDGAPPSFLGPLQRASQTGLAQRLEGIAFPRPDRREDYWSFDIVPMPAGQERPGAGCILAVGYDVTTELVQANLLQAIFRHARAAISVAWGENLFVSKVSDFAASLLGRPRQDLEGMTLAELRRRVPVFKADTGALADVEDLPLARAVRSGEAVDGEVWLVEAVSGERIPILASAGPIVDGSGRRTGGVLVWQDLREQVRHENQLRDSLEAKETLLNELSHRVKNNFQMAASLLVMQAIKSDDPRLQEELERAGRRINALASIHHRLHQRSDFDGRVDVDVAIREMCGDVAAVAPHAIDLRLALDPLELPAGYATPLLMLVNELVSNAYKHAFPTDQGTITVSLRTFDGGAELAVSDDGVGLPADFRDRDSLGLVLAGRLARQIGGELQASSCNGARFAVSFGKPTG